LWGKKSAQKEATGIEKNGLDGGLSIKKRATGIKGTTDGR